MFRCKFGFDKRIDRVFGGRSIRSDRDCWLANRIERPMLFPFRSLGHPSGEALLFEFRKRLAFRRHAHCVVGGYDSLEKGAGSEVSRDDGSITGFELGYGRLQRIQSQPGLGFVGTVAGVTATGENGLNFCRERNRCFLGLNTRNQGHTASERPMAERLRSCKRSCNPGGTRHVCEDHFSGGERRRSNGGTNPYSSPFAISCLGRV